MKKLNKILLTLSLVLCLGGGLLIGIGAFAGGIDEAQEIAGARMQHYDQEKTQLDEFSALDVDLAICDMEIRPSNDEHAYLESSPVFSGSCQTPSVNRTPMAVASFSICRQAH